MIFSIEGHIDMIKRHFKTHTRRDSDRYLVGKEYAIQPARTEPGIPDGKVKVLKKREERKPNINLPISAHDADCEGGYTVKQFEKLYEELHPGWTTRWAYIIKFIPTSEESKTCTK